MSSIVHKVQEAFTGKPQEAQVVHRQKILLAVSSTAPQLADHRSGFFFGELLHPFEVFTGQGWDCDIVSETGSARPDDNSLDKMATSGDKKAWENKEHPIHAKLAHIRAASQVNSAMYSAIFFAGGHAACVDFPHATHLQQLAAQIYENGGVIGAVCHGPAIFQGLRLSTGAHILQGKEATGFATKAEKDVGADGWMQQHGYRTMQDVVTMSGGIWREHESDPMKEFTCVSDRIVTGMNPASAKAVAETMLKFMPAEREFEPVKEGTTLSSTTGASAASKEHLKQNAEMQEREKARTYQGERATNV